MKTLHDKIKQLKKQAKLINYRGAYYDASGNLVDLKITTEGNIVKGYLVVWNIVDTYGTAFVKGCCAKSINERGPLSVSKQKIAHLWQHQMDEPLGQYTVLREDDYGLYFEAAYDDIPQANRAAVQIKSGTLNQFSIGFDYVWDKMEYNEDTNAIIVREIDLYEGSVVTIGSNSETHVIRSVEEQEAQLEVLRDDIEIFIKTIPRKQQIELRALITQLETLAIAQPIKSLDDIRKPLKKSEEKTISFMGYKLDPTQFKNN